MFKIIIYLFIVSKKDWDRLPEITGWTLFNSKERANKDDKLETALATSLLSVKM